MDLDPPLPYHKRAGRGTPKARENVEKFIGWARNLGLKNPDVFTPDDLILVMGRIIIK